MCLKMDQPHIYDIRDIIYELKMRPKSCVTAILNGLLTIATNSFAVNELGRSCGMHAAMYFAMLAMTRLPQKERIVSEVLYSETDITAVQLLTLLCQYEGFLLINGGWSLKMESNSSRSFSNKTF